MKSFCIGSLHLFTLLLWWAGCVSAIPPSSPTGLFYHDESGFLATNYHNSQEYAKATDITPPYFLLNVWYDTENSSPRDFGFGHILIGYNSIENITYFARGCDPSQLTCDSTHAVSINDEQITLYIATFDEYTSTVGSIFAESSVSFNYNSDKGDASYKPITFNFGHLSLLPNVEYVLYFKNHSRNHIQFLSNADTDLAPAVLYRNGAFVRTNGDEALLPLFFAVDESSVGSFKGNVVIAVDEILNNDPHWFLADLDLPAADDTDAVSVPANSTDFELYFYNNQNKSFTIKDITIFVKAPSISTNLPVIVYGDIEIATIAGRTRNTRTTGDQCVAVIADPISTTSFTEVDFTCGNGTLIPENTTYTFRVNTKQWFSPYALSRSSVVRFQGGALLYNTPTAYTWVYENGTGVNDYVSGDAIRYEINPFVCKHGESRGCNDCRCFRGFDVGYWGGDDCGVCATNFYGLSCNKYCNANKTCHGNGTCDTQGGCSCASGFTGLHCESTATSITQTKRSPKKR